MTTRDSLLAAIASHPDDDTPRLIYADYLDETGDSDDAARALLIRTQIEATRLSPDDVKRTELDELANELWEQYQQVWFDGINPGRLPFPERGFITHWGCYSANDIAADLGDTFRREPIISLTLSVEDPSELASAQAEPALARVQELKVWPGITNDEGLVTFFRSPYLTALRQLDLMGNRRRPWGVMSEAARVLATLPQYSTVRELVVHHADLGNSGALAFASSRTLGLITLGLSQCDIGPVGLRGLLESPVMSTVTHLALGGNAHTAADGESLAEALAASKHLAQLETLWLDETAFTDQAARLLGRRKWPKLKHLAVLPHAVGHSDEDTDLATMSALGVESLVAACAPNLETLELDGQPIGDAGAAAIAHGSRLSKLQRLSLVDVGLTAVGLQTLTTAYSKHLHYLQVARNELGDAAGVVIADVDWPAMIPAVPGKIEKPVPFFYEQRGFYLGQCGVGVAGAEAMIRSNTIPRNIPDIFLGQSPASNAVVARLKAKYPGAKVRF